MGDGKKVSLFIFSIFPTIIILIPRILPVFYFFRMWNKKSVSENCGKQFDVCLFKHFGGTDGVAMGMVKFTLYREWFHLAPHAP